MSTAGNLSSHSAIINFPLLPSHMIEHIAGMTDVAHLRMMWCVCGGFRALLMESWHSWDMVGRRTCGKEWWDGAIVSLGVAAAEAPSQFARRVICPWLLTPRFIDVFPPSIRPKLMMQNDTTTPTDYPSRSRAWRVRMNGDEKSLLIDSHTSTPTRGFWFEDDGGDDHLRLTYSIPARSGGDNIAQVEPRQKSKNHQHQKVDPEFVQHLKTCKPELILTRRLYHDERVRGSSCCFTEQDINTVLHFLFHGHYATPDHSLYRWHLHAGVIVASFSCSRLTTPMDVGDAGGLGFLSARTGKLLHFLPLTEEVGGSDRLWVARPGEMWVLEKWANRVLYFGTKMEGM